MKPEPFTLLRLVVALRGEAFTNTFTRTAINGLRVAPKTLLLSARDGSGTPPPLAHRVWNLKVATRRVTHNSPVFKRRYRDWPELVEDVTLVCEPGAEAEAEDALRAFTSRILTQLVEARARATGLELQWNLALRQAITELAAERCPELPL